jgi:hypothetical protein
MIDSIIASEEASHLASAFELVHPLVFFSGALGASTSHQ